MLRIHIRSLQWATNGVKLLFDNTLGRSPAMGDFLKQQLGATYIIIGLTTLHTHVDWLGVGLCGALDLRGRNAIENVFAATGEEYLLLDLKPRSPQTFLDPYIRYSTFQSRPLALTTSFDALVYIKNSLAMHPLRWAPCQ